MSEFVFNVADHILAVYASSLLKEGHITSVSFGYQTIVFVLWHHNELAQLFTSPASVPCEYLIIRLIIN